MAAAGYRAQFVTMIDPWTAETRIQDPPQDPAAFMTLLQKLAPPEAEPITPDDVQILGLEIALDFTPKAPRTLVGLDAATVYLMRHHAHPDAGVPRITRRGLGEKAFEGAARMLPDQIEREFAAGWTVYSCERGPTKYSHYYTKRRDSTLTEAYALLPVEKHCARIEKGLLGDDCPFHTLSEWAAFQFEILANYFAMVRESTAPVTPINIGIRASSTQFGRPKDGSKAAAHRRTSRAYTRRDSQLNKRIARALANLTNAGICHESEGAGVVLPLGNVNEAAQCPKYLSSAASPQSQQQPKQPPTTFQQNQPNRVPQCTGLGIFTPKSLNHPQQQAPPHVLDLVPPMQKVQSLEALHGVFLLSRTKVHTEPRI